MFEMDSSKEKSFQMFHRVDGMSSDDHSIWTSSEMSSTPMYITVDTSEAFPEMPPSNLYFLLIYSLYLALNLPLLTTII